VLEGQRRKGGVLLGVRFLLGVLQEQSRLMERSRKEKESQLPALQGISQ